MVKSSAIPPAPAPASRGISRTRTAVGAHTQALSDCTLDVRVPEDPCFLARPIPVEVFLLKGGVLQHASKIPLQVHIDEEFQPSVKGDGSSGVSVIRDGQVSPDGSDPVITDGVSKFSVVAEERAIHGHKVRIQVSGGPDGLLVGKSMEFTLHKYMLTLGAQSDEPFYKDEGGKNKCMELQVSLVNESAAGGSSGRGTSSNSRGSAGNLPEAVPLAVTLLYEDGNAPYQQEILSISPDSELVTDKRGRAKIRFRIEEVSKSHRGQKFRVLISADTKESPTLGNVAPVKSDPILVLSKRKPPGKLRQGGGTKRPKAEYATVRSSSGSSRSSSMGNKRGVRGAGGHLGPGMGIDAGGISLRRGVGVGGGGLGTLAYASESVGKVWSVDGGEDEKSSNSGCRDPLGMLLGLGAGLMDEADTLAGWARRALWLLHDKLQWEVVGYEVDRAGSPDARQPIYRCPSCRQYRDASSPEARHKEGCHLASVIENFYNLPQQSGSTTPKSETDKIVTPASGGSHNKRPRLDATSISSSTPPPASVVAAKESRVGGPLNVKRHSPDYTAINMGSNPSLSSLTRPKAVARNISLGGLSALGLPPLGRATRGASVGFWLDDHKETEKEKAVHYILGTALKKSDGLAGVTVVNMFAAFDKNGSFVGCYQEELKGDLQMLLIYHEKGDEALEGLPSTKELEAKLQAALEGKEGTALSLSDGKDLGELKKRLLMEQPFHDAGISFTFGGGSDTRDLDSLTAVGGLERLTSADILIDQVTTGGRHESGRTM